MLCTTAINTSNTIRTQTGATVVFSCFIGYLFEWWILIEGISEDPSCDRLTDCYCRFHTLPFTAVLVKFGMMLVTLYQYSWQCHYNIRLSPSPVHFSPSPVHFSDNCFILNMYK